MFHLINFIFTHLYSVAGFSGYVCNFLLYDDCSIIINLFCVYTVQGGYGQQPPNQYGQPGGYGQRAPPPQGYGQPPGAGYGQAPRYGAPGQQPGMFTD